jgi:RimJ/RimL family protein N-acetyltransferase
MIGPVPALAGSLVRLEPLTGEHVADLAAATDTDRSSYRWTDVPSGDRIAGYVAGLLAERDEGVTVPLAQVAVATGRAVGVTRYLNLRGRPGAGAPYAVEVGGTWLSAAAQRTGINTEAKLLLFAYAFEVWSVGRLDLKTDVRNDRSRQAIERVGGRFEGVLRSWQPSQAAGESDLLRDTAMYSVTAPEWPAVRLHLLGLLDRLAV